MSKIKRINTSLTPEEYTEIKQSGYKVNDLIRQGLLAKKDNPQLLKRLEWLENRFERINALLETVVDKMDTIRKV